MSDTETLDATDAAEPTEGAIDEYLEANGDELPPEAEASLAGPEEEQETPEPEPEPEEPAHESPEMKLALARVFDIQDRLEAATDDHADKAEVAKTAKKRVESLQEDLSAAVRNLRDVRTKSEPDPDKFPLFDRPKDEINAQFAKPESIQPLPAGTLEEFCRRKAVATRLDSLGLTAKVVEVLAEAGVHTIRDIQIKTEDTGASLTSIKGVTEKRAESILEALMAETEKWLNEWEQDHPKGEAATEVSDDDTTEAAEPA